MNSKQFLVRDAGGTISGPYSSAELVRMASEGRLTPDCFIQQEGSAGPWHPASKVKGLQFETTQPVGASAQAAAPAAVAGTDSHRWWLARPGEQPLGPYAWADLLKTVKQSGGPGDWMACAEGASEWKRLDSDPALAAALQRPATPARVPDGFPAAVDPVAARSQGNTVPVLMHLSVLSGIIIPLGGLIVPLILWLVNRGIPRYDAQGKEVMNWVIFLAIYSIVGVILSIVVIGLLMLVAGAIAALVLAIMGAVKSSKGEFFKYPLPFRLIK